MIPYDEVLKELVLALGAALFLANAAGAVPPQLRRRAGEDPHGRAHPAGEPGRGTGKRPRAKRDLAQAPLGRTLLYMGIGLVVMIWSLASLFVAI